MGGRKATLALVASVCLAFLLCHPALAADADKDLVAHWDFDEGKGDVLHDRSGNENHGKIHGAKWVKLKKGCALQFDGADDTVDCGAGKSLDITGPLTLQAWIRPAAAKEGERGIAGKFFESYLLTYYYKDGKSYFYISSGGNPVSAPVEINTWTHVAGTFDGTTMHFYVNGRKAQTKKSLFRTVKHGKNFLIGCIIGDPAAADPNLRKSSVFKGFIDDVRVHNSALSQKQIVQYFNIEAASKGQKPFAASEIDRFLLELFTYPDQDKAVLSVDFRWMVPLPKGVEIFAELTRAASRTVIESKKIDPAAVGNAAEAEFSLKGLKPGNYKLGAVLRSGKRAIRVQRLPFRYPLPPLQPVVAPSERVVGPLAPPVTPPSYDVEVAKGGGLAVTAKGRTWRVESTYSYPHGGENRLLAGPLDKSGESAWSITTKKVNARITRVKASGNYYSISRLIEQQPTRILVKDTIRSNWNQVLGIIFSNRINVHGAKDVEVALMSNPTIFVAGKDSGVGLIALDDLYQLQQENAYHDGAAEIRTEHFGLDKGASYTIEWAVYPTATNDYYDFINQVRRDEGINGHMPGMVFHFYGCLGKPVDDPEVSLEGIEFMKYPKECARLVKKLTPYKKRGRRVGFHVAHGLYATNKPEEVFPDSLVIKADGKKIDYGNNRLPYYRRFFSEKRIKKGYRWFIFYPTMENSFGKAMIEAMEYMADEMGMTSMWADGFVSGYAQVAGNRGGYSYDRWDGHSVDIDPKTKLVTRKKTCVTYVALPVLKEVIRIISEKGGPIVTNGRPGPRSLWQENMVTSCETDGSDARSISALHLGRTVTPLPYLYAGYGRRGRYRDILRKLDFGALMFTWGSTPSLVRHMYPITFESIHVGTVRGKERIITKKSGVYGWPATPPAGRRAGSTADKHGDRSLHIVYLYDARGGLTWNNFLTTVGPGDGGVRTELTLHKEQSAAVVKLPITLTASQPVNVNVRQYDTNEIRMVLNGKGGISVRVRTGDFAVKPGVTCKITTDQSPGGREVAATGDGVLSVSLTLDGPTALRIEKQ